MASRAATPGSGRGVGREGGTTYTELWKFCNNTGLTSRLWLSVMATEFYIIVIFGCKFRIWIKWCDKVVVFDSRHVSTNGW